MAKELESFAASVGYGLFFAYVGWVVLRIICSTNKQEIINAIAAGVLWSATALVLAWFVSIFLPSVILQVANMENGVYFKQSYRISEKIILKEKIGFCYEITLDREKEGASFIKLGTCTPYEDYKKLEIGDVVSVLGRRSTFGITAYDYKY